jgi:hypothetical protein
MVSPNEVTPCLLPPPQSAIEALERLRASYNDLLARESLTAVDRAVLAAVEITLQQVKYAQTPANRSCPL